MLDDLPSNSKIWIFPLNEPVNGQAKIALDAGMQELINEWKAHGTPVAGRYCLLESQFIVLGAPDAAASGCSIDWVFKTVTQKLQQTGLVLAPDGEIWYRHGSKVSHCDRQEFIKLTSSRKISPSTPMIDPSISSLEQLRSGLWERPYNESWHSKAFPLRPTSER